MRAVFTGEGTPAIGPSVRTGSESRHPTAVATSPAQTDSEVDPWFAEAARALLGSDPGFALSIVTGVHERSCYRYAAGDRPPTAHIVRVLLRSPQGWQWLCAAMEGCDEEWWREMKRARARSAALDAADGELSRA